LTGLNPSSIKYLKPNIQYEDFTWEAKGQRAGKEPGGLRVFEQTGTFFAPHGELGSAQFPIPYAVPPNVELTAVSKVVIVIDCTPTGFRWKNTGSWADDTSVTWTAKGIRATEVPKPAPK